MLVFFFWLLTKIILNGQISLGRLTGSCDLLIKMLSFMLVQREEMISHTSFPSGTHLFCYELEREFTPKLLACMHDLSTEVFQS